MGYRAFLSIAVDATTTYLPKTLANEFYRDDLCPGIQTHSRRLDHPLDPEVNKGQTMTLSWQQVRSEPWDFPFMSNKQENGWGFTPASPNSSLQIGKALDMVRDIGGQETGDICSLTHRCIHARVYAILIITPS